MFTVIIPTMWRYQPFYQFLEDMVQVPSVGQIIIIDNDPVNRPDLEILKHNGQSKIDIFTFNKNIYVNPAWNLGVKFAKFDRICLYGDDLIFDLKLFQRMLPHISSERGVYGICPGNVEMGQPPLTNGNIDIIHAPDPYHYRTNFGFGMLMFLHKSNWIDIPEELKLYWGDNFVFDTQYYMMNQNYFIANLFHHTPFAVTTSKIAEHGEMLTYENHVYNSVMPQLLYNLKVQNSYRTGFN
jgi:hypothetical protein